MIPLCTMNALAADIFKDAKGAIYVDGATAESLGDSIPVAYIGVPAEKKRRVGYCREIIINATATFPNIGARWEIAGQTYQGAALPVANSRCQSNIFEPPAPEHFLDNRNRIVLTGFAVGTWQVIKFLDIDKTRRITKRCGFFRIASTKAHPLPEQIGIDGSTYTTSNLPEQVPPLCRKGRRWQPTDLQFVEERVIKNDEGIPYIVGLPPKQRVKVIYAKDNPIDRAPFQGLEECKYVRIEFFFKLSGENRYSQRLAFFIGEERETTPIGNTNNNPAYPAPPITRVDSRSGFPSLPNPCNGSEPAFETKSVTLSNGMNVRIAEYERRIVDDISELARRKGWVIYDFPYQSASIPFQRLASPYREQFAAERMRIANSCGIVVLSDTPRWKIEKLGNSSYRYGTIASNTFTVAALPVEEVPLCRNGVFYQPVD